VWHQTAKKILTVAWALSAACPALAHAELPDGRRYELVSPSAKLGNDVMADSSRTRAAAADAPGLPMAVTFTSLGGFADVQGMGVATEYLAQRTCAPGTSGWATHAITPPQAPLSLRAAVQGLDPLYEGDMAPDLTRAIFRAWSPLTDAPNVAGVENLYARTDMRSPGAGAYTLLTDAASPLGALASGDDRPYLAGTSSDLEHVIFESRLALTPDATAGNVMLYKSDRGVVRLLAPGATCPSGSSPATPCSIAGLGATALRLTTRAISADGSSVEVTSPINGNSTISTVPEAPSSLYQFDDQGTSSTADDVTVKLNESEKSPPDAPQASRFQTASIDGERVFFTSAEQLTDTPGSGLYLWQRTPAGGAGHLTLIGGGSNAAAVGASEDGRRVYFTAPGQLIPGGPFVNENGLYLWQDADGTPGGSLAFVGGVGFVDATAIALSRLAWNLTPNLARVTPDGRTLLFEASDGSGLAPQADHGACASNPGSSSNGRCSQLYVYRADHSTPLAPEVVCASCDRGGVPGNANAFVNVREGAGAAQVTWHLNRAITDDGRRVFFSSAQPLVRDDVNGRVDAYEYDVASGALSLVSSGHDAADSWFLDASANGDDVFFVTRERLVGWDTDSAYDLYDARVGGGFSDPPLPPQPCAGEACRGLGHAAPPVVSLGSAQLTGATSHGRDRARPAKRAGKRCRRGYVERRVHGRRRCLRRAAKTRRRGRRR
jgi:hypothetical protein